MALENLFKNESSKFFISRYVPIEQKEQIMKYKGLTIHKNKTCSTWYTRYTYNKKQYYVRGKTQKECLEKLKVVLSKLKKPSSVDDQTFLDWYNKWFTIFKKDRIEKQTLRDYNNCLNKLKSIHDRYMNSLTPMDIVEVLESITAERMKQKVYELLKAIFTKAKLFKVVEDNIIELIEKPKHTKSKGIALTLDQQNIFIKLCDRYPYGDMFKIILYQGLRIGEMLGLTVDDIDLKNKKININKAFTQSGEFTHTKNEQSMRIIPIFDRTLPIIMKYLNKKGRLFEISYNTANKIMKKMANEINMPQITTHDLRHTFITNCKNLNVPEHVIQALVGHEIGSKVTSEVYTHYNLEDNIKHLDIINQNYT